MTLIIKNNKMNYKRREKFRTIKAKLLRALGITKPIQLSETDIKWIKLCKLHYKKDARYNNYKGHEWTDALKPMFDEIYGWSSEEYYNDFLVGMFSKLLDIHLRIQLDKSGDNNQLKSVFTASFGKSGFRQQELPIERAISDLCGWIQNNQVIEYGVHRYYLDVKEK